MEKQPGSSQLWELIAGLRGPAGFNTRWATVFRMHKKPDC